jgi:hypothetical protein
VSVVIPSRSDEPAVTHRSRSARRRRAAAARRATATGEARPVAGEPAAALHAARDGA